MTSLVTIQREQKELQKKDIWEDSKQLLDYQWTGDALAPTFSDIVKAGLKNIDSLDIVGGEELKQAVINHHKKMIDTIRHAPRKYGRGVNLDLVNMLRDEVEKLKQPRGSLSELDKLELEKMTRLKAQRKEKKAAEYRKMAEALHAREKDFSLKHLAQQLKQD